MDFFGLDIGSYSLKLAQLKPSDDKFQLVGLGSSLTPVKGLASEAESDLNSLAEAIKKLHQEAKIKTKNVATALPQDQVFTRVITLPKLSEDELNSALKWEAEQYVPIPLEEATLTHQIIGQIKEGSQEKMEVLLAAAPNRLIEKTIKVLKTAGFNLVSLETEIIAIARSLVSPGSESVLLVDFGAKATDIAIVEGNQLVFIHSISTAGEALTRAVGLELGLNPTQAEAYKKAYGVDPVKLEGKVSEVISPVVEIMLKEIEKAIQFYQTKQKTISRVVLAGGTATLPEIAALMTKKLNLEIQLGDPFSRVIVDGLARQISKSNAPLYALAVGLALKKIS